MHITARFRNSVVCNLVCVVALAAALTTYMPVKGQTDLERKIQLIFLREDPPEKGHDPKAEIEQLGSTEEVQAILLNMLTKYKHFKPETKEYRYLSGATRSLGIIEAKAALRPLLQLLFDRRVHENTRANAARSLGQIDPEGSKQAFLKALANVSDYYMVRIYAAEGLAKTKDPQVLKTLERYSRAEKDAYVRQRFDNAARELRARIRSVN